MDISRLILLLGPLTIITKASLTAETTCFVNVPVIFFDLRVFLPVLLRIIIFIVITVTVSTHIGKHVAGWDNSTRIRQTHEFDVGERQRRKCPSPMEQIRQLNAQHERHMTSIHIEQRET